MSRPAKLAKKVLYMLAFRGPMTKLEIIQEVYGEDGISETAFYELMKRTRKEAKRRNMEVPLNPRGKKAHYDIVERR